MRSCLGKDGRCALSCSHGRAEINRTAAICHSQRCLSRWRHHIERAIGPFKINRVAATQYRQPPAASSKRLKPLAGTRSANNLAGSLMATVTAVLSVRFLIPDFRLSGPKHQPPNHSVTAATQVDFLLWTASASVNQSSSAKYCLARCWNCTSREFPCSSNASCTLGTGRMAGIGMPPR
jgi:hypothetical protein